MVKKFKLNGKPSKETLVVEIGGDTFSIPLAKSMKMKELRGMKDEESVYDFFAKHIGTEILDELTAEEYTQIVDAWTDANKETEGVSLGE